MTDQLPDGRTNEQTDMRVCSRGVTFPIRDDALLYFLYSILLFVFAPASRPNWRILTARNCRNALQTTWGDYLRGHDKWYTCNLIFVQNVVILFECCRCGWLILLLDFILWRNMDSTPRPPSKESILTRCPRRKSPKREIENKNEDRKWQWPFFPFSIPFFQGCAVE